MILEDVKAKPWPTWHYIASTMKPPTDSTINWIPYVIVVSAVICILILCCLCSSTCRGLLCCFCCCSCCQRSRDESETLRVNDNIQLESGSPSGSLSNSLDRIEVKAPALPTSIRPTRYQVTKTLRTQKYDGSIIDRSRPQPRMYFATPSSAPPAAKAVARTVKIIGNMLTYEGSGRKRRKK